MSNGPQLENGFVKIANELLEAIIPSLSGPEAVFFAVIRMTYGYNRLSTEIPLKKMVKLTGISMKNINRTINLAVSKGYINILSKEDKKHPTYRINKNYSTWKTSSLKRTDKTSSLERINIFTGEDSHLSYKKQLKDKRNTILKTEKEIDACDEEWKKRNLPDNNGKPHLVPDNFEYSFEMEMYAREKGILLEKVPAFFQSFMNWAKASGKKCVDWDAQFLLYADNAPTYGKQYMQK
jgi:phage replication O-like protein O